MERKTKDTKNIERREHKKLLQTQLRELGIQFPIDTKYDDLKKLYQDRINLIWKLRAKKGTVIRKKDTKLNGSVAKIKIKPNSSSILADIPKIKMNRKDMYIKKFKL